MKDKWGVLRPRSLLFPSLYRDGILQRVDLIKLKKKHKPRREKDNFKYKQKQFMVCILLLVNRSDTSRIRSLLTCLKCCSKQEDGEYSRRFRLILGSNQGRNPSKGGYSTFHNHCNENSRSSNNNFCDLSY
jgi:hypothetical protein